MFKKSLLALALAGVAMSASAVETKLKSGTAGVVSVEGLAAGKVSLTQGTETLAGGINISNVAIVLGAEYTQNDIVTIEISGAEFSDPDTFTLTEDTTTTGVKFGLLNKSATKLTFRVTTNGTAANTGKTYNLAAGTGFDVKLTSIANDGKVTVTTSAKTSGGDAIDSQGTKDTLTILTGKTQYTSTVTTSDAVVDVAQLRKGFEKDDKGAFKYPTPKATIASNAVNHGSLTTSDVQVDLVGDFAGIDTIKLGAKSFTIAKDMKSATVKTGAALTAGDLDITFTIPSDATKRTAITAPQDIKATVKAIYDTSKELVLTNNVKVSSWTLNGDTANIDFVPFQEEYARSVTVTNRGDVEGDVNAELFANGKMVASAKIGTAAKYGVTDVSAALNKLAADNGVTGFAGVRITTNAPDANIDVNAIYYHKADKDRVKTK
jgi:hypothetical protein